MKNNKKRIIIIIMVLLVILALIYFSYAYIKPRLSILGEKKIQELKIQDLSLNFSDGNEINVTNIEPGWSINKTISITNTGTNPVTYDIVWENISNTFIDKSDLVISATCTGLGCISLNEQPLPISGTNKLIIDNITINKSVNQTYTFTFKFLETSLDQSINLNKALNGKISAKLGNYSDTSTYLEPDQSLYITNTIGKAIIDNNSLITLLPDFNKNAVSETTYNSLTNDETVLCSSLNAGTISKECSSFNNQNGLFKILGSDGYYTYFFRGEVNNVVSFAGLTWRILRINEDGTIRLVLNDGINNNSILSTKYDDVNIAGSNYGKFTYMIDGIEISSLAKKQLDLWYLDNLEKYDNYISSTHFCNDITDSSKIRFATYNPSYLCNSLEYILKIGLLTSDDLIFGGLGKGNYSSDFMYAFSDKSLTLSTNNYPSTMLSQYNYYKTLLVNTANSFKSFARPVISIYPNLLVTSGNGSIATPYVISVD